MKKIVLLSAAFLISAFAVSQDLDFSGSWKLNTEKSKLGDQFSMAPKEIIIVQKGNEFNVEKHSSFQDQEFTTNDKFTLDGKECINTGWQDSQKKSTTAWSDDKKSLTVTSKMSIGDGGDMTIVEAFKMDGANLVIESSASSSYGDLVETQVYDKK
ncbi:MAG: hypothetical protein WAL29_14985 [Bacteroidales bacterium]